MRRRFRKRNFRRKAIRKYRRKYKKAGTKYDGLVAIKCNIAVDVTYDSNYTHGDCTVNWGSYDAANNPYIRITQSGEYLNMATLFREYRVVGVKMKWMPITQVTSVTGSYYQDGWVASATNVTPNEAFSDGNLFGAPDYKSFDPSKPYTKYVNCGKYYAKRGEKWLPVG